MPAILCTFLFRSQAEIKQPSNYVTSIPLCQWRVELKPSINPASVKTVRPRVIYHRGPISGPTAAGLREPPKSNRPAAVAGREQRGIDVPLRKQS